METLNRRAFVTGATGFVGQYLVRALRSAGFQSTLLARSPERLPALAGVDVVRGDLRDAASVQAAVPEGVDAVFHVAAHIDFNTPEAAWEHNVTGTQNLLDASLHRGAKRFVFTSTAAVWGLDHERFDEDSPRHGARAGIAYIDSKVAAEERVQGAVERGLAAVILNPGHIVGASTGRGWDQLFTRLREGRMPAVPPGLASWCAVDDLVRAQIAASEQGRIGANYLIGGCDATYQEFAAEAARRLGVRAPRSAPAWLIHLLARTQRIVHQLGGPEPELAPDLARIMCGRLLFSSARAEMELGYRGRDLGALMGSVLPGAPPTGTRELLGEP